MSIRKETKTRNYFAHILWDTKAQAEKEARGYKNDGKPCRVAYIKNYGDSKSSGWVCWRWTDKKRR